MLCYSQNLSGWLAVVGEPGAEGSLVVWLTQYHHSHRVNEGITSELPD